MRNGTLGGDVGRQVQVVQVPEIGLGSVDKKGGEAFQVVVRGRDRDGEPRQARHQSVDVFRVGAVSTQQLQAFIVTFS